MGNYANNEFEVIKEDSSKKLVKLKESGKYLFLTDKNTERRNFSLSINSQDKWNLDFMEFIFNQSDLSNTLHYLIEKKIQAIILSCNFAAEIENDR